MDYKTTNTLILELKNCWIKNAHDYNRKIPDSLLVEALSHYDQACEVLRMSGKEGDLERVALAQMQLKDFEIVSRIDSFNPKGNG